MKSKTVLLITIIFWLLAIPAYAQSKKDLRAAPEKSSVLQDSSQIEITKPQKSVTQGSVTVDGKRINYRAVAGTLILKNKEEKPTCSMFYTAYFKADESDPSQRPVTFIYNGGPGSATLWLHIGAFGPQRVWLQDTARTRAPYKTVNNDYSLLDASDLVFIDMPGTGFGQIITKEKGGAGETKDFYGTDADAQAFASFITQFISTYDRWNSPKYLFGESYGTTRSAVLCRILEMEKGVSLNGVILLSQILNFGNDGDIPGNDPGNDTPYELLLPSFAATAWYHHKIPNRPEKMEPLLREVEHFAETDYNLALRKGSELDSMTFNRIADKLHEYTGLSTAYIRKANLRISGPQFEHELLNEDNQVTGRLDTRFRGYYMNPLSEEIQYSAMTAAISAAFISTINTYLHATLKYGEEKVYAAFGDNIFQQWNLLHQVPGKENKNLSNVMPDLARAMIYDPGMKVMLNMAYFDLGTPYFQGLYEMRHLPIPAGLKKNISYAFYHSGHMVYLHPESLKQLHDNVAKFIEETY